MKKNKFSSIILISIFVSLTILSSGCGFDINYFRKKPTNQSGIWISENPNMYFESAGKGDLGIGEFIVDNETISIAIGFGPGLSVYIGYLNNEPFGVGEFIFKSDEWTMKEDEFIINLEGDGIENNLDSSITEIIFMKSQDR